MGGPIEQLVARLMADSIPVRPHTSVEIDQGIFYGHSPADSRRAVVVALSTG